MAGLESIALAVAHLEKSENDSDGTATESTSGGGNDSNSVGQSPNGANFGESPRLVSSDTGAKNMEGGSSEAKGKDHNVDAAKLADSVDAAPHTTQTVAPTNSVSVGSEAASLPTVSTDGATMIQPATGAKSEVDLQACAAASSIVNTEGEGPGFSNQISQKILLKCKQEDGASDDPVAHLLARVAAVTDNLALLYQLMDELCAHARKEYGDEKEVPGTDEEITAVGRNDVLSGRGGESNHHYGNGMLGWNCVYLTLPTAESHAPFYSPIP